MAQNCITVNVVGVPKIEVIQVTSDKTTAKIGEKVTINAIVKNNGTASGSAYVILKLTSGGKTYEMSKKTVTLNPGDSTTVTFTFASTVVGTKQLCVDVQQI